MDPTQQDLIRQKILDQYNAAQDNSGVEDAQDNDKRAQVIASIGQALSTAATAPAVARGMHAPDQSLFNTLRNNSRQDVQDAIAARQNKIQGVLQDNTLQSGFRKEDQDTAKIKSESDNKLADNARADKEFNYRQKKDAADLANRQNDTKVKQDELKLKTDQSSDDKSNKRFSEFGKELDSGKASSRSDFGKQQSTISNADRVLALGAQGDSQDGGLTTRQIHELAISSAALVSGGNTGSAQGTINALVPHSYAGSAAGIEEWLLNEPKGANQQAFVKQMLETADREKQLASEKVKGYKAQVLSGYKDLEKTDPERYGQMVSMHFGDNPQFDKNGAYVPKPYAPTEHSNSFPRTVRNAKTGESASVSNADELKEAAAEGFN